MSDEAASDAAERAPGTAEPVPGAKAPEGLSRRGLLGLIGAGAGATLAGFGGGAALGASGAFGGAAASGGGGTRHPFSGAHQSGITTPVQDHLHFAAFDLEPDASRADLVSLLQDWSYAAARMTAGLDVSASGAVGGPPEAPPDDTGEALGLPASALTLTFGFGPGLFERDGVDRFGIRDRRPAALAPLPRFLGDDLDPLASHGELCVQACADDPQVAVHAVRNLSRIAFGRASLRWSKLGFGRTSRTSADQSTPRNLFGFKDGTANVLGSDGDALAAHVWVDETDDPAASWLAGGSYLVARSLRMRIETWDRVRLSEQERSVGRSKGEGAPLSGGTEFTPPVFGAGSKIDAASHVALAHPDNNGGARMLRRGYNFVDGNDERGSLNAGLFFLAYVREPGTFVTVQRALSRDLLSEYFFATGSAIFAVPPGAREGSFVGESLFA